MLRIPLGIIVLGDFAAAICINWTQESARIDNDSNRNSFWAIYVEALACPADAEFDCHFTPKPYHVTDKRGFYSATDFETPVLSEEEMDDIFQLAQDGFNSKFPEAEPREFITRNGTVSTAVDWDDDWLHDGLLVVEPGWEDTLQWISYRMYSIGTLDGCSNEALNNMSVVAHAPYLRRDPHQGNRIVLAGHWSKFGTRTLLPSTDNSSSPNSNGYEADSSSNSKNNITSPETLTGSVSGMLMVTLRYLVL
jgi:hypothetical protein